VAAAIALGLFAAAVAVPRASRAAAQCQGCVASMRQATHLTQGDIWGPRINSQRPPFVTFTSDGDVEGPGSAPGHREIYLYDVDLGQMTRVTTTVGGESYDATRLADEGPRPRYLAFISTGDLDPAVGNADGSPELFFWELSGGGITQITNNLPPLTVAAPFVSDSGRCVMFHSTGDLDNNDGSSPESPGTGFSNPDASVEAFMYEVPDEGSALGGGRFTQISNGPAGTTSSNATVGGYVFQRQCATAAFQSDHDQLGTGEVGTGVYVYDRSSGNLSLAQTPDVGGSSLNPFLSGASNVARGPFILYHSNADMFGNGSSGFEIYRLRVFHPRFVQYTFTPTGDTENATISDGGGLIAFQSSGELLDPNPRRNPGTPFNADGNHEVFLMRGRNSIQQVTDSAGCENTNPGIHGFGEAISFRSTCDLVPGHNPSAQPQLFVYRDVPKPDLGLLAACTLANACCHQSTCYTKIAGGMLKIPKPSRGKIPIDK
jgi:hypothetical protein